MPEVSKLVWSFVVGIATSRVGFAADWPQWLGPARNGTTTEVIPVWKSAPTVLWRHEVGNGYSSPIVSGGATIVHAAVTGKDAEVVSAYHSQTGELLWS